MNATILTASQIATLRNINERPGISEAVIGFDYAAALQAAGFITLKKGRCYPTAAATAYQGRSPSALRAGTQDARAAVIGRWSAAA